MAVQGCWGDVLVGMVFAIFRCLIPTEFIWIHVDGCVVLVYLTTCEAVIATGFLCSKTASSWLRSSAASTSYQKIWASSSLAKPQSTRSTRRQNKTKHTRPFQDHDACIRHQCVHRSCTWMWPMCIEIIEYQTCNISLRHVRESCESQGRSQKIEAS